MLTIANLPTQNAYVEALTLGPMQSARAIKYVVANKSVFARIWPQSKDGTIPAPTDELLITPETNIITDAMGIQFRSAVPGVPAQVVAQLLTPGDPLLGSGTPFSATISSSGAIQPGVSSLQFEQSGALISTEPIFNLINGAGIGMALADDAANQRANLTVAVAGVQSGNWVDSGSVDFFSLGLWLIEVVFPTSNPAAPIGSCLVHCGVSSGDGVTRSVTLIGSASNGVGVAATFAVVNNLTAAGALRITTAGASGLSALARARKITGS